MSGLRGRTRAGRLNAISQWVAEAELPRLRPVARVIDVGFGDEPLTTVEWSESLGPSVEVIGVDVDPGRVEAAQPHSTPTLRFVREVTETASVVRAMNVLRGYTAPDARAHVDAWGRWLVEGGVLVEGSTDTEGHVAVAQLLRRSAGALVREGLLFHTDFSRGFSPWLFRDWLPREFRRGATPAHAFLASWSAVCDALPSGLSPRERFERGTEGLERRGDFVVWRGPF